MKSSSQSNTILKDEIGTGEVTFFKKTVSIRLTCQTCNLGLGNNPIKKQIQC